MSDDKSLAERKVLSGKTPRRYQSGFFSIFIDKWPAFKFVVCEMENIFPELCWNTQSDQTRLI